MDHVTREELLEIIDDPSIMTVKQRIHLDSCRTCSAELEKLASLITDIAGFPEPEIDEERLEEMAIRIDDRIASLRDSPVFPVRRHRKVPKWAVAVVLPIAAAALLFLLPQIERWSSRPAFQIEQSSEEDNLSRYQWQLIWDGLLDDMNEVSMLPDISPSADDPVTDLKYMSDDELERFLGLLEEAKIG